MMKLGKVSSRTKGVPIVGFADDVARLVPGAVYPIL